MSIASFLPRLCRYLVVTRMAFLRASYYRFELVFDTLRSLISVGITLSIWNAIYRDKDVIGGFRKDEAVLYTVSAVTLALVFEVQLERALAAKVRKGTIALDFLRPVDFFLYTFFENMGSVLYSLVASGLPTAFALGLFLGLGLPGGWGWLWSIPLALSGYLLFYVFCHLTALLTFLTEDEWGVVFLRWNLVRFLAGTFLPLTFFPGALGRLCQVLPFRYMIYVPASAIAGRIGATEVLPSLAAATAWTLALVLANFLFWKVVVRRVTIHGG